MTMKHATLLLTLLAATVSGLAARPASSATPRPNVVVIVADDLGYGDVGCYGAKRWATPNVDRLASEGVRFTDFYVAQAVCSASRTALLTGCYPNRLGIQGALGPNTRVGLADSETTMAAMLKAQGYSTEAIGKWHLGHQPPFLPTRHGFDGYLGLPYSNDMWPHHPEAKAGTYPPLPLIDGETAVDPDVSAAVQATLTARYTARAVKFIAESKARPFFLYLAYASPHVPLYPGARFRGSSKSGVYGDVVQEIDSSVGEVLRAIKDAGAEANTLVVFTSDNGPWLSYGNHAGSAGPLREGKGTVWEGGVRVPFVARLPGTIPAGSVQHEPAMNLDLFPTVAKLVGAPLPARKIDGKDVMPLLRFDPGAKSPHRSFSFYYATNELQAVRSGRWKLILPHTYRTMIGQEPGKDGKPGRYASVKAGMELYDLAADPGETTDVASKHPAVVEQLMVEVEAARADLGDSLTGRKGAGVREPGRVR